MHRIPTSIAAGFRATRLLFMVVGRCYPRLSYTPSSFFSSRAAIDTPIDIPGTKAEPFAWPLPDLGQWTSRNGSRSYGIYVAFIGDSLRANAVPVYALGDAKDGNTPIVIG